MLLPKCVEDSLCMGIFTKTGISRIPSIQQILTPQIKSELLCNLSSHSLLLQYLRRGPWALYYLWMAGEQCDVKVCTGVLWTQQCGGKET